MKILSAHPDKPGNTHGWANSSGLGSRVGTEARRTNRTSPRCSCRVSPGRTLATGTVPPPRAARAATSLALPSGKPGRLRAGRQCQPHLCTAARTLLLSRDSGTGCRAASPLRPAAPRGRDSGRAPSTLTRTHGCWVRGDSTLQGSARRGARSGAGPGQAGGCPPSAPL